MHILIAPNAFKNSLDAAAAAEAIKKGLQQSQLDCTCECFPIGDGGDGTGDLMVEKCKGKVIEAKVQDALGRKVRATYGLIEDGRTAVIEMAAASGVRLLSQEELNPLTASSFGTGQLIRQALSHSVRKVVIAMGGSATVDGGSGMLRALGVRFLDAAGKEIADLPAGLPDLGGVDLTGLDERITDCEVVVLCDVENRLLGDKGAAAVFGPQKGAKASDVPLLEAGLARLSAVVLKYTGRDMAAVVRGGTAGGAAAGLFAFLNASLVNGIDYYLQATGFNDALQRADLLITGEGSIDDQTLHGKGPFGVACAAKESGIPVIGIAGKVPLTLSPELKEYFEILLAIGNEPCDMPTAMSHTRANIVRTSAQIGNLLSIKT